MMKKRWKAEREGGGPSEDKIGLYEEWPYKLRSASRKKATCKTSSRGSLAEREGAGATRKGDGVLKKIP